ncbi:MAG: entericidin A/B family lipoprotein [Fimbriimonadaceae bacterium]
MKGFSAVGAAILLFAIVGPSSLKCNTFKGAGQDIQAGGRGIQNVAEDAQHRDNENRRHQAKCQALFGFLLSLSRRGDDRQE